MEVRVVDVRIHSEEALENILHDILKVLRERHVDTRRKHGLIIENALNPGHEIVNILWSRHLDWFLDVLTICPQVLILRASAHDFTGLVLWRAVIADATIQDVDLIEEIDSVNGKPLMKILSLGNAHRLTKVAAI